MEYELGQLNNEILHIRVQQHKGRKFLTIIEYSFEKKELESMIKFLKKKLNCGGHVASDDVSGKLIGILNGDHRTEVSKYIISLRTIQEDKIMVHGA